MIIIEEKNENYSQVFYFCGEIDSSNALNYKEQLCAKINNSRFKTVIFDFSNTLFIDSAGIGLILGRYNEIKMQGKNLRVRGINMQLDKIFKVSGLYQILDIDYMESKVKI